MELNKFSKRVTQDDTQPAAQAMLHAIGLSKEDLQKPFVGIASTGYEGNPCNMHLNDLAKLVKKGTGNVNLVGLIFNTIGVSDGISMGTPGMRYSLPSRDVIADSMETVVQAMSYDGLVTVVGTEFNVQQRSGFFEVQCFEGVVKVTTERITKTLYYIMIY